MNKDKLYNIIVDAYLSDPYTDGHLDGLQDVCDKIWSMVKEWK